MRAVQRLLAVVILLILMTTFTALAQNDTESYESNEMAFLYPADWYIQESGAVVLVSNDERVFGNRPPNSGWVLAALLGPAGMEQFAPRARSEEDYFDDILTIFELDYTRPEEVEISGRAYWAAELDSRRYEGAAFLVTFSNAEIGFLLAFSPAGDFGDFGADVALILDSFDSELQAQRDESDECADPGGDFPARVRSFDEDYSDVMAELVDAEALPDCGELAFEEDNLLHEGDGNFYDVLGDEIELTNYVYAGELTFTSGSDELELCSLTSRSVFDSDTDSYTRFMDVGLINTGFVLLLERFDPEEDAIIEISEQDYDLDDPHHFIVIVFNGEATVYVDGRLVFERVEVEERAGTFGFAMISAGRRAECEANNIWAFDLGEGAAPSDEPSDEPGDEPGDEPVTDVECVVRPLNNSSVNIRSGPGTEFSVEGTLSAGDEARAVGQASGALGAIWWNLEDGGWVRFDLVEEEGDCDQLPTINP
ncbi:MAG: SH3 domain-containing protein [Chloroflexi bacterium]|nr:SH3 domain-containing protein [Chloroflexota bacterium]